MSTLDPGTSYLRRESEVEGIPQSILDQYAQYNEPVSSSAPFFKDTSHRDDPGAGLAEYADTPEPVLDVPQAPAPAAAPAPVVEPVVTQVVDIPVEEPAAPVVKTRKVSHRRRQLVLASVAVAAFMLVYPFNGHSLNPFGLFSSSTEISARSGDIQAAAVPAANLISADQTAALSYFDAHSSFDGYVPLAGGTTQFTAVKSTAVFGRSYEGSCWVYAVTDGKPTVSNEDPSGVGCSPEGIQQAHAQLVQLNG